MQSCCLPELVPNPDNSSGIYDTVETVSNSGTGAVYEGEQSQPQVIYGGQGKKRSDGPTVATIQAQLITVLTIPS